MLIQSVAYHVESQGVRTESQILDNFRDIRSKRKATSDQADGIRREPLVMMNLSTLHRAYGAEGHSDKIDSFETEGIDTVSQRRYDKPDYFYYLKRPAQ